MCVASVSPFRYGYFSGINRKVQFKLLNERCEDGGKINIIRKRVRLQSGLLNLLLLFTLKFTR